MLSGIGPTVVYFVSMAIHFRVRDFFHPVGIWRLHRDFERHPRLDPEIVRRYQDRRLAAVAGWAGERIPYYRDLFRRLGLAPGDISRVEDLARLPVMTKEDIRRAGPALSPDPPPGGRHTSSRTSGTSGEPVTIRYDRNANNLEFVYYWRHWGWAGYRLGDRFAELETFHFLRNEALIGAAGDWQPLLGRLLLNSSQLSPTRAPLMAEAIRRRRPRFLKGMASSLYFLALSLREAGVTDLSFRAVFSTGEVLTPLYRDVIGGVFNAPVLDSYGHMERTMAVSECLQGGYHINPDYGILEILPAGEPSRGGARLGRVTGTSLHNLAMPLLRYDTGDTVELHDSPLSCPCGRTFPLIKAIHGRHEDVILTPDGRHLTSLFVVPELTGGIRFVQFIQDSPGSIVINVVPGADWSPEAGRRLLHYAGRLAGETMAVRLNPTTEDRIRRDASGKIRAVISEVGGRATGLAPHPARVAGEPLRG
jgi:phenylacetate-CoA ligase